jgi:hypothetical protein
MKKRLTVFILLVCAIAVFFIGWVQFSVPVGKYGILISKTGGVNSKTIIPGAFRWQWEKLIPTNTTIITYDLTPKTYSISAEGILPSGDLYQRMLEGNPDFSWKIGISISGRVAPRYLPYLVRLFDIKDQTSLDNWVKQRVASITENAGRSIIADVMKNSSQYPDLSSNPERIAELLKTKIAGLSNNEIEILDITPQNIRIPDFNLYALAAQTYTDYQTQRQALFNKTAASEADTAVAEYLQIERFARWGELLTKYPILIDFLALPKDSTGTTFSAVKNFH